MTLVPPFETELPPDAVVRLLPKARPIVVHTGGQELFGAARTVPVLLIEPSVELGALHLALVDALEAAGARIADQRHIRDGYRPHLTVKNLPADLPPGTRLVLGSPALVDRAPDGRRNQRRVVAGPALG